MDTNVSPTTAYITGAGSGIGLEMARRYARQGTNLALFDLRFNDSVRQEFETTCEQYGGSLSLAEGDVTDAASLAQRVSEANKAVGEPDLVLHCAGINLTGPFTKIPDGEFEKVVNVNLMGTYNLVRAVLPLLQSRARSSAQSPRLVVIASMAGLVGNYGYASYCASKFGVIGLAQTLRMELKPEGIRVQVICPPEVDTPMVHEEHKTIHPVTLKLKLMAGALSLDEAIDGIMKGMQGRGFLIIPGVKAKLTYWMTRLVPTRLSYATVDRIVRETLQEKSG